ncbi:MAG: hypothetical protein N2258_02965 [Brevinematales bacterium]|nr:hypothetical protein [Brevinematales bacterium]
MVKNQKLFIIFFIIISIFINIDRIFSIDNIFLKGGGGIGYDSNLLFSKPFYPTELYLLTIEGLGKWGKDKLKFIVNAHSDIEIYNVYYNYTIGFGSAILLMPWDEILVKFSGNYNYTSDINQSFSGKIELKQDIFEFATTGLLYNFENSIGLNGVTNQSFILHNFSISFDFDLFSFLELGLIINDSFNSYSEIKINEGNLKHNSISITTLLKIKPSYNYEVKFGGGYSYHDSFNTNLIIFYDTNIIYLYNTANQYKILASLDYEWNPNIKTSLLTEISLSKLVYYQINENDYRIIFYTDHYFTSNWKMELNFLYNFKNSELFDEIDRWRISTSLFYLF